MARVRRPDLRLAAEARSLAEAREAAEAGADVVMLDNMTVAQVRRAVQAIGGRAQIEVTGGVTLRRAGALARAGVHRLSVGALTHSAEALDFSLSLAPERRRRRPAGKRR
jgi:nicotinate-nucleotide pyrophosphorylase (carboxylating)